MGKSGNFFRGGRGSFVRYAVIVTLLFILWAGFLRRDSMLGWVKARMEFRAQEKEKARYRHEIEEMEEHVRALTEDLDSLEQFARETYRFHAPDEEVFIDNK